MTNEQEKNSNIDEKVKEAKEEIIEEIKEENIENKLDNYLNNEEVKEEVKEEAIETKTGFFTRLIASIIDGAITLGISLLLLFLMDIILKASGYLISDRAGMALYIFIAVTVLYTPILNSTKLKKTFGKAITKINE